MPIRGQKILMSDVFTRAMRSEVMSRIRRTGCAGISDDAIPDFARSAPPVALKRQFIPPAAAIRGTRDAGWCSSGGFHAGPASAVRRGHGGVRSSGC